MCRLLVVLTVLLIPGGAWAEVAAPASQWQLTAACAAGYRANFENRMSIRAPSMSESIDLQAEDYKGAATRLYQKEMNVPAEEANERVGDYVAANVARYIAMDKAGTLEAFLDSCPDTELDAPN